MLLSFHEVGFYDIPASVDYILKSRNVSNMKYIGHSEGTTTLFVTLSAKPEYNKKISTAVVLAPGVYFKHINTPYIPIV